VSQPRDRHEVAAREAAGQDRVPAGATFSSRLAVGRDGLIPDGGRPLAPALRASAEAQLGPLGEVRLHTGGAAARAAARLDARAYAYRSSIVFGDGAYAPDTTPGYALLLHELAHTQQDPAGAMVHREIEPQMSYLQPPPEPICRADDHRSMASAFRFDQHHDLRVIVTHGGPVPPVWGMGTFRGPIARGLTPPTPPRILEAFVGPSLASPTHLMEQFPGSTVMASEPFMLPSGAEIDAFSQRGGVFYPERFPSQIPAGSLDQVHVRFPMPHDKGIKNLRFAVSQRYSALMEANPGLDPLIAGSQAQTEVTATVESMRNLGPYALRWMRSGATMEVVFDEAAVLTEIDALTASVSTDAATGGMVRFEVAEAATTVTRGAVAPYSGLGIKKIELMGDAAPVQRIVLRKVPVFESPVIAEAAPPGGGLRVPLATGEIVAPTVPRMGRGMTGLGRAAGFAGRAMPYLAALDMAIQGWKTGRVCVAPGACIGGDIQKELSSLPVIDVDVVRQALEQGATRDDIPDGAMFQWAGHLYYVERGFYFGSEWRITELPGIIKRNGKWQEGYSELA
jgi:hypothetical protein